MHKFHSFVSQIILSATLLASLPGLTHASLVITEVMSSGVQSNRDWWELTNTGPGSVGLQNYQWEDNPAGGFGVDTAIFPNVSIAAGESIIVTQMLTTDAPTFSQLWGLGGGVQVLYANTFTGSNTFSGLGSGGDGVVLYNPGGSTVASVTFGTATAGSSFEWDTNGTSLGVSVNGSHGAYIAPGFTPNLGGDIGSPGASVPEPASLAVLSGLGLSLLSRRRRV